jgi:hypothetical protein
MPFDDNNDISLQLLRQILQLNNNKYSRNMS